MDLRCASNPKDVKHYTTERLREEFHISGLFTPDNSKMVYSPFHVFVGSSQRQVPYLPPIQALALQA